MSTHQIHVFISHSWTYSEHYKRLREWVFEQKWQVGQASLRLRDYSVSKDDPIHNAPTASLLRQAILRKIARSHVIVIPTGMYANYSKWIREEIRGAKRLVKPKLAVDPWGQERSASVVAQSAKKPVGWNRKSVVRGIWELYYK